MDDSPHPFAPMFLLSRNIPLGGIVMFSGAVVDIPAGFQLCDGTNGTPDLRTKFVVGAGGGFAVGNEGGSFSHKHDFTGDGHLHFLEAGTDIQAIGLMAKALPTGPATGTTLFGPTPPAWYALAYIMETG